ncbi:MAG: thiamine-phosphate kinase [Myxococcota bacterium]|nr:thiamine-phosphate kinase [Myxococcota bacterium]
MRSLSDLGERELIDRIARLADSKKKSGIVLGIGDDAAILRPRANEDLVTSTDTAVEDVHFRWVTQSDRSVGRRALISNLSDLAAMGARPSGCLLALSAPPDMAVSRFEGLMKGLLSEAHTHACPLIGGNLSRSRETSLAITVFGTVPRGAALRRDGLRAGDGLYVTGSLGGAALALARSEQSGSPMRWMPVPRLRAGQALVRLAGSGACIDVSDGLVSDLEQLLRASHLGAELDADSIPMPRGFEASCRRLGLDAQSVCLAGGEDYELLFSLRSQAAKHMSARALSRRLGVPVTRIGTIRARPGIEGLPSRPGFRHY